MIARYTIRRSTEHHHHHPNNARTPSKNALRSWTRYLSDGIPTTSSLLLVHRADVSAAVFFLGGGRGPLKSTNKQKVPSFHKDYYTIRE